MYRSDDAKLRWLAHSARPRKGVPAQTYEEHVRRTLDSAKRFAERVARHARVLGEQLTAVIYSAAELHDLGKLIDGFQAVLRGEAKRYLMGDGEKYNHADVGTLQLLGTGNLFSALLVYSHHIGLPAFAKESLREDLMLRSPSQIQQALTKSTLNTQMERHQALFPQGASAFQTPGPVQPLFFRLALSCLVDADHSDTAEHYGEKEPEAPMLRAGERLTALDVFVANLSSGKQDDRTRLRTAVYRACRDNLTDATLVACDSPVGTGKTTAVMAHLLAVAERRKLDRIIVVLPYTNIIDEAVATYRNAIVLAGESPELVVAAHHHRADFHEPTTRAYTALWRAPVVVTTAVQFYETLAAATPAALRRLHAVPGSAIFIDEAHASLPVNLLPLAWRWHNELSADWGCHCVFASGSLTRYWRLPDIVGTATELPELVEADLQRESHDREHRRVNLRRKSSALDLDQLCDWLTDNDALPGPRLLIVNTVQSAAVIAEELARRCGRNTVEHLSSALLPRDRKTTLNRIRHLLWYAWLNPDDLHENNWTLVATTCVEAGVNLSFRTGMRERAGLVNLLQAAGRVNRDDRMATADVWTFTLQKNSRLTHNRAFDDGATVLDALFERGTVSAELCADALRLEIRDVKRQDYRNSPLIGAEESRDFPEVERLFRVIDGDSVLILIDENVQRRLDDGERVVWRDLQDGCVNLYRNRVDNLGLLELPGYPGLFRWTLGYDEFLGVMRGILDLAAFDQLGGGCV